MIIHKKHIYILILILITAVASPTYSEKNVVVDPGHCEIWAGTDGYGGAGGINEFVRTLEIGLYLELLLGCDLDLTRISHQLE